MQGNALHVYLTPFEVPCISYGDLVWVFLVANTEHWVLGALMGQPSNLWPRLLLQAW